MNSVIKILLLQKHEGDSVILETIGIVRCWQKMFPWIKAPKEKVKKQK